jgi:hypothetical protein
MNFDIRMSWDGECWSDPVASAIDLQTAELIRDALMADDDENHHWGIWPNGGSGWGARVA